MAALSSPSSSDWDLFALTDDDDNVSFEEMSETTDTFSLSDNSTFSSNPDDSLPLSSLTQCQTQHETDEYPTPIKSEDGQAMSPQSDSCLDIPLENLYESPLTTPLLPPEFDKLESLPYEIVERSTYLPNNANIVLG
jgi:hypothetical protein